jgi:hypothetical protein
MVDTPEGKARFENYEDRVNRAIAARGPQEASAAPATTTTAIQGDKYVTSAAAPTRHVTFDTRVESHDVEGAMCVPPGDGSSAETSANDDDEMIQDDKGDDEMGISNVNQPGLAEDDGCLMMLAQLGVETKSFQREHKTAMRRLVSEVDSPPRVTKMLSKMKRAPVGARIRV